MVRNHGKVQSSAVEPGDISAPGAHLLFFAILAYSLVVLSPLLKTYFLRDDFFSFQAPPLKSLADFAAVYEFASRWGSRFLHLGIYFSVGQGLWDHNPFAWHLANLVVWTADVLLLWGIYLRLLMSRVAALIATAIFALSGAHFYTQGWITGSVELFAGLFTFSAFLCHLWAIQDETTKSRRILRESLAIFLLSCAFVTKETTIPIVIVWVIVDYLLKKRITSGGIAAIIAGIGGMIIGILRPLTLMRIVDQYAVTFDPMHLAMNFAAYFFDPILATGAEFWIIERLNFDGKASQSIGEIAVFLSENMGIAIVVGIILAVIGISWFVYTVRTPCKCIEASEAKKAVVPRWLGWLAWFIFLVPAIVTPGHHIPYYVMLPLAFLMLAVGPALADGLKSRNMRIPVIIGLVAYIAWFPVNTALAFRYSNLSVGAREISQLFELIDETLPEEREGWQVILDGIDPVEEDRMGYVYSIEWRFSEVEAMFCQDLHSYFANGEEREGNAGLEGLSLYDPVLVLRLDNGVWTDVNAEYRDEIEAMIEELHRPGIVRSHLSPVEGHL